MDKDEVIADVEPEDNDDIESIFDDDGNLVKGKELEAKEMAKNESAPMPTKKELMKKQKQKQMQKNQKSAQPVENYNQIVMKHDNDSEYNSDKLFGYDSASDSDKGAKNKIGEDMDSDSDDDDSEINQLGDKRYLNDKESEDEPNMKR